MILASALEQSLMMSAAATASTGTLVLRLSCGIAWWLMESVDRERITAIARRRVWKTENVSSAPGELVHPVHPPKKRPSKMFQKIRKKVWTYIMLISNMSQNFNFKFVTEHEQ